MHEIKYHLYYILNKGAKEEKKKLYSLCDESAVAYAEGDVFIMNFYKWKVVSVADGKIAGNY